MRVLLLLLLPMPLVLLLYFLPLLLLLMFLMPLVQPPHVLRGPHCSCWMHAHTRVCVYLSQEFFSLLSAPCAPLRYLWRLLMHRFQDSNFTELEKAFAEARKRSLENAAIAKEKAADKLKEKAPKETSSEAGGASETASAKAEVTPKVMND